MKKAALLILIMTALLLTGCSEQEGEALPAPSPTADPYEAYRGSLFISELMGENRATLPDEAGLFLSWAELRNSGAEPVSLEGWSMVCGGEEWLLPAKSLEPGQLLLLYGDDFDFSGERLSLVSPSGLVVDGVSLLPCEKDASLVRGEGENMQISLWPSPGFENAAAGYEALCQSRKGGALLINEVSVFDLDGEHDWVEIINASDGEICTEGWYLSDEYDNRDKWQLPALTLQPGQLKLIRCGEESGEATFSLDSYREEIYLSAPDGSLSDYAALHDVPLGGSMGRMPGEGGFFYFAKATPAGENGEGKRCISAAPTALTPCGVFDGVESVTLELEAEGSIFYTTDGSYPGSASIPYTGAIEIDKTCVIRAVAVEDGALASDALTLTYIINEGHCLPVISLVLDDWKSFSKVYTAGWRGPRYGANLSFFEEGGSFSMDCLAELKGWTSRSQPKKSLGVSFKGVTGGMLQYDLFGNGITEFASLSIRAGQDYTFAYIRNELFQNILLDIESEALAQESRYSVLYLNGKYWGLYCLKEDFSKQFYASHEGVSRESVESHRTFIEDNPVFRQEVYGFCLENDLSKAENYEELCRRLDIDAFIDWYIIEGYSANTDIRGNTRYFRSAENGGRWKVALFDLDWAMYYHNSAFNALSRGWCNAVYEQTPILSSLMENETFRKKLIARYAELIKGPLSNESMLERIDLMAEKIEPEVSRDRLRWRLSYERWLKEIEKLKSYIVSNDYDEFCTEQLSKLLYLSPEEREMYFGE